MPAKRKDGRNQSSVIVENPITGEQVKRFIDAYDVLYPQAEKHSYPSRYRNPRNLSRHLGKIKGMQTEYYLYLLQTQATAPTSTQYTLSLVPAHARDTSRRASAEQKISTKKIQVRLGHPPPPSRWTDMRITRISYRMGLRR